jgi:hypothetical protein
MGLALCGGSWSRSGGNLGSTVRHGTFEARRWTDQHGAQGDADAINHSGDTNESLEQSSLSSFSSNASTAAASDSGRETQEQLNLSSDSDTLTALMIEEAAGNCTGRGDRRSGDYGSDDSADELSSVSMQTVLASLAKVKETLVQSQQQQQQQQQEEDEEGEEEV